MITRSKSPVLETNTCFSEDNILPIHSIGQVPIESDISFDQVLTLSAADRLAQIDEQIVLEKIRVREIELAHLKAIQKVLIPASSVPPDDNISVLEGSPHTSRKSIFQNRSSTIIKTIEKDLLAHILDTSEKGRSFAWIQLIVVYIGHGGRQNPWSFLHSQRRKAFEKYLSIKIGAPTIAEDYYEYMIYDSNAKECQFIRDYISFIIQENNIKEDDFLDHCMMKESQKFNGPKIRDYILAMGETIDMFSNFHLPIHLQVQKLVLGIQPVAFRDIVITKNRAIFTFSWEAAVNCIEKDCKNEEDAGRHFEQGHGRLAYSNHKSFDKGGIKDAGKTKGKSDPKPGYECSNCHNSGHNAGQCDKI